MKAVILAGGLGTRLSEETATRPKPMVEIGGKPILWHIMKMYSHHGINDFIVCCGYKVSGTNRSSAQSPPPMTLPARAVAMAMPASFKKDFR